jgi:hypothetical protein
MTGETAIILALRSGKVLRVNLADQLKAGLACDNGFRPQRRVSVTSKAARLMPCSSLLVGRRGARRTDRDCVLAKEAYLDVGLYFHRVAKNFIWAKAPMPDGLDARFC